MVFSVLLSVFHWCNDVFFLLCWYREWLDYIEMSLYLLALAHMLNMRSSIDIAYY